ncbi:MAG: TetR/AcrR family transcriptional regulator [Bacteroidota bacterium]
MLTLRRNTRAFMSVKERRQREREARKQLILDASERLIKLKGIDVMTMTDVANEAELAKGTLYLYFKNKDQLLAALSLRGLHILLDLFKKAASSHENCKEKIKAMIRANFEYFKKYPAYYELNASFESKFSAVAVEELQPISDEIYSMFNEIIKKGLEEGSIHSSVNSTYLAHLLWSMTVGVIQFINVRGMIFDPESGNTPEDMFDQFIKLIDTGMTGKVIG